MIDNNKNNNHNLNKQTNSKFQQRLQQLLTDLQLDDAPAGGSLVVYQAGRCIVQANVGMAQANIPWQSETLSLNFSTGKGVLATLVHVLVSQQLLDYDTPIANYWPEFSSNGKANITLRALMSHQANLFSINSIDADNEVLLDWGNMLNKIAAMPIILPEDSSLYDSAYSALVYGWVLGGLIEAVTGMSLAEALRYYLTEPLDIADSCFFGVPSDKVDGIARLVKNFDISQQEHTEEQPQLRSRRNKPVLKADSKSTLRIYANLPNYRCWEQHAKTLHTVVQNNNDKNIDELSTLDTAQINRLYLDASQLNLKNYKSALIPANKQAIDYYNRQTLQAVIPAANGVASAKALATIYSMLANGGKWQGRNLIDAATFEQLSTPQVMGMDAVMPAHMNWRLGYHRLFSVCADTEAGFGHMGYNGSVAWCDPIRQLSFAFIHNFDVTMLNDIRQFALTEAILNLVDTNIAE